MATDVVLQYIIGWYTYITTQAAPQASSDDARTSGGSTGTRTSTKDLAGSAYN